MPIETADDRGFEWCDVCDELLYTKPGPHLCPGPPARVLSKVTMIKTSDWLLDPEREHDESICYDDDLPIYEAAMGAAREARALEATIAELRREVETLRMLLLPVGSITFPPGCQQYEEAKALFERRILGGC